MGATGVRHWSAHSSGKVLAGLLIGAGILLMVAATFIRSSRVGIVFGIVLLTAGITAVIKAIMADNAYRQRQMR